MNEEQNEAVVESPAVKDQAEEATNVVNPEDFEEIDASEDDADDTQDDGEDALEEDGGEEDAPEVEMAEWEDDDGNKYELPASLVPKLMKDKDYTQKTQQIADTRRKLDDERAAWEAQRERDESDMQAEAELFHLNSLAEQYKNLDWNQLAAEDIDDARAKQFYQQQIRDRIAELKEQVSTRREERSRSAHDATVKRIEEAEGYAASNIPGWNAEKAKEIWDFAQKHLGYDEASLRNSLDGRLMKAIHMSYIGEKAMARANSPAPKKPTSKISPTRKVNSKSTPTTRMAAPDNPDEYRAWRQQGGNARVAG
jgi:hypothetical protein